jgi:hypothetical protein
VAHFDDISGALNQISKVQVCLKLSGAHLKSCKNHPKCDYFILPKCRVNLLSPSFWITTVQISNVKTSANLCLPTTRFSHTIYSSSCTQPNQVQPLHMRQGLGFRYCCSVSVAHYKTMEREVVFGFRKLQISNPASIYSPLGKESLQHIPSYCARK